MFVSDHFSAFEILKSDTHFAQDCTFATVIYQITNMVNSKYYIGSAQSYERRVWQHKYDLKKGIHKNPRLQAAWNKYGEEAFVFEVLETIPENEDQLAWENRYLHVHVGKPECYNINRDAEAPRIGQFLSEESKLKLSINRTGKAAGEEHYRYGKQVSDETRKKIGDTQRGKPQQQTPDSCQRAGQGEAGKCPQAGKHGQREGPG